MVREAVRQVLAPLGGMPAFVKPGERIAIKPNMLMAVPPERAITTHPAVVAAVALEVREAGAVPVVVDGPGTGVLHLAPVIERAFRAVGYREVADRYGFELSVDTNWQTVSVPGAVWAKQLDIMTPILEADGVINLPKFKTHMYMTLSAATKNLFGVIPGLNKAAYHGKLPEPDRFADMLLDVAYFIKPRLHLVDGITALEGNGPGTGGSPRQLGVLVAGADPTIVDVACCRIAGLDARSVPTLVAAEKRGFWSGRAADVDTLGVPVAATRRRRLRASRRPTTASARQRRCLRPAAPLGARALQPHASSQGRALHALRGVRARLPQAGDHTRQDGARWPWWTTRSASAATAATRCARRRPSTSNTRCSAAWSS